MVLAHTTVTPCAPAVVATTIASRTFCGPSGASAAGRTHRAGQRDGLGRCQHGLQEERGLLDRVGAVRDHHAHHIGLRQPVRAALRQPAPDVDAHVLAVDLRHLLGHELDALRHRDAPEQVGHPHLARDVADVVVAARRPSRDGPAGAQHHHAARIHGL